MSTLTHSRRFEVQGYGDDLECRGGMIESYQGLNIVAIYCLY